jgi:hypothetical protein
MIDDILTTLVDKWNTENKCGKCWVYIKTFNDHIKGVTNTYAPTEENKCCTHIFLEGLTIKTNKVQIPITGQWKKESCDYQLHLKIVEMSDFQMQKGDELNFDESIYSEKIKPLEGCLACSFEDDVCAMFEETGAVFNEVSKPLFSSGDINWAGLDYKLTVRQYV